MGVEGFLAAIAGDEPATGAARPGIFRASLTGVSGAEGHGFAIAVDLSAALHGLPSELHRPVILGHYDDACAEVLAMAAKYRAAGVILIFVSDNRLVAYGPKASEDKVRRDVRAAAAAQVRAAPLVASPSLVREAFDVSALQLVAETALVAAGFTVVTAPPAQMSASAGRQRATSATARQR